MWTIASAGLVAALGRSVRLEFPDIATDSSSRIAICGPSGSGKTTLMSMLGGLLKPTYGSVTVSDADGRSARPNEAVSWIVQSNGLLRDRTAFENVLLGALTSPEPVGGDHERARRALAAVGLQHRSATQCRHLSGGEVRRVAIARALMADRPFILADEPTSNLDPATTNLVIDVIFAVTRGLIVASHDEAVVERCSRRIDLR